MNLDGPIDQRGAAAAMQSQSIELDLVLAVALDDFMPIRFPIGFPIDDFVAAACLRYQLVKPPGNVPAVEVQ